jgi:hypothetical protein
MCRYPVYELYYLLTLRVVPGTSFITGANASSPAHSANTPARTMI